MPACDAPVGMNVEDCTGQSWGGFAGGCRWRWKWRWRWRMQDPEWEAKRDVWCLMRKQRG